MDDKRLTWYMNELCMHGFGARRAFLHLDYIVHDPQSRQTRMAWFHLVSFLGHAAMISKYLDPLRYLTEQKKQRKILLRQKLGVEDNSPVLSRAARDNVEHFDERIDNWTDDCSTIIECVFENRASFNLIAREGTRIKRVLIIDECVFISECRNQSRFEIQLMPLHQEIQRIDEAAESWIKNNSPYHFIDPN